MAYGLNWQHGLQIPADYFSSVAEALSSTSVIGLSAVGVTWEPAECADTRLWHWRTRGSFTALQARKLHPSYMMPKIVTGGYVQANSWPLQPHNK